VADGFQTPAGEVVMYDRFENHSMDGGNVLFSDGHVEFLNKAFYERHLLNPSPATTRSTTD
jgi:prepilin-type processing-associated H-X9-DG protein